MPIRRVIDRIGHLEHRPLKILTHPTNQFVTIHFAKAIHGLSPFPAIQCPKRHLTTATEELADPNSRGRRLRLLLGLFVVETPRILLQYSSFLRLDPEQNPRRDTAREFRHGLLASCLFKQARLWSPTHLHETKSKTRTKRDYSSALACSTCTAAGSAV